MHVVKTVPVDSNCSIEYGDEGSCGIKGKFMRVRYDVNGRFSPRASSELCEDDLFMAVDSAIDHDFLSKQHQRDLLKKLFGKVF